MTSIAEIGEVIVLLIAVAGFVVTVNEIKKSGLTFKEPITHGKNRFDVAFREFVRATLRGLVITLWGNENE